MKNVLLLFGGNSFEHEVSCHSVKSVYRYIDRTKFKPTLVGITKDNKWLVYEGNVEQLNEATWTKHGQEIPNIIIFLNQFDVVFPLIHGNMGEDGKLQGFLELFDIPYVGSSILASAVGMDKECTKIMLHSEGIPQVPYTVIRKGQEVSNIKNQLSYPVIVKPASLGSSIGITKVNHKHKLKTAIKDALRYDKKVIIESFIEGQELECAVLEKNGKIIVSSIGEIISAHEFYDYQAKYNNIGSTTHIPANIPLSIQKEIQMYAKKAFQRLEGKGLSRIDFFYDKKNNQIYLNEINTIPGFTEISMYPKLLMHDGFTYQSLITCILLEAISH